jgi:hypothetical protein
LVTYFVFFVYFVLPSSRQLNPGQGYSCPVLQGTAFTGKTLSMKGTGFTGCGKTLFEFTTSEVISLDLR